MKTKAQHARLCIGLTIVTVLIGYEAAFRFSLRTWGELNPMTSPVSLYFTLDYYLPGKPIYWIFWIRYQISLGKVPLSKGTGLFMDGKTFYRRCQNGAWDNISKAFKDRQLKSATSNDHVEKDE